jgi:hypothetical protein
LPDGEALGYKLGGDGLVLDEDDALDPALGELRGPTVDELLGSTDPELLGPTLGDSLRLKLGGLERHLGECYDWSASTSRNLGTSDGCVVRLILGLADGTEVANL